MRLTLKLFLLAFLSGLAPAILAQRPDSPVANFARDLIKSDSRDKRSELLAARRELVTAELGQELIKQGNFLLLAGKYSSAFDAYSLAEHVSEDISNNQILASAVLNLGTVYYFQGNYAPALEHYRRARSLFTSAQNDTEAAKALSGMALVLKEQRKETEALAAFAQALKEFESLDDKEEMANQLSSMGAIHYSRGEYDEATKAFLRSKELNGGSENVLHMADAFYMQGDYLKAANYYQESLKTFEQENNAAGLISALGGAANSNYYLGKFDEALDYYRRNLDLQKQQRDESGIATSLQGIGNVYRSRGDLISALQNYEMSVDVAQHSDVKVSTASTIGSIGLVKMMQGEHVQAAKYFRQSLTEFEETGDKVGMARMLGHLGNAHAAIGDYEAALESYSKSLKLRESMDDKTGQAGLHVGMGTVFSAQQKYPQALESFQKALQLYETVPNQEAAAYVLTRLADTHLLQGEHSQTLELAQRAYTLAKEVENYSTAWYARFAYGKAQRAANQPEPASKSFLEAITLVESLRAEPGAVDLGDGRSTLLPFLSLIEVLIDQNKAADAFEWAERARGQALSELLRKSSARIVRGMSAAEQTQERKIVGDVVLLYLQLERQAQSRTYDEARQTAIRNQLRLARTAYAEFRKNLFTRVPDLKVARGQLTSLKLEEAQALIGDSQTALLEYLIAEDHVYLFVLTQDVVSSRGVKARKRGGASIVNLKLYPLSIPPRDLATRISQFQELLVNRDEKLGQAARELHEFLVQPAKEQIDRKTNLIVVPDGILWRLPFAALKPSDDSYLIDSAAISYVPSLTALREMRRSRAPRAGRGRAPQSLRAPVGLSVFGDSVLSPEVASRLGIEKDTAKQVSVVQSPQASSAGQDPRFETLRSIYGGAAIRVFERDEANEERARSEATRPNSILQFSVPTILDDAMPMYSAIGLSPKGQQLDGMLQTLEVLNLNSQARLLVLSDTETRGGRLGPGEALVASAWGWFIAGTPAIALTRWRVESAPLTQLMSEFHAGVKSHFTTGPALNSVSTAEAVRRGMLALRRSSNYQHPYYWSELMLLGDGR